MPSFNPLSWWPLSWIQLPGYFYSARGYPDALRPGCVAFLRFQQYLVSVHKRGYLLRGHLWYLINSWYKASWNGTQSDMQGYTNYCIPSEIYSIIIRQLFQQLGTQPSKVDRTKFKQSHCLRTHARISGNFRITM